VLALLLLAVVGRVADVRSPRRIGFEGALGGLMLAVMSIPIPLFAMEYCITLAGPVGVLLGAAAGFQVAFVVSLILALLGQGGFTVVGLNALVMGAGVAVARPVYRALASRTSGALAMAGATAATQLVSGKLWFAVLAVAMRLRPGVPLIESHGGARLVLFAGASVALWGVAVLVESVIAYGVGRFLERVRPDLLRSVTQPPGRRPVAEEVA
jgi:cobalt/nickel transport system permease protein